MEVIKTEAPVITIAPNYYQYSKFMLISMIKGRDVPLKYGFSRTKSELIQILMRLDAGELPRTILNEQKVALYN